MTKLRSFNFTIPFQSDHKGFKSSRLDSYNKLGVVVVTFQTAPRSEQMLKRKRDRKLAVQRFCQWPLRLRCRIIRPKAKRTWRLLPPWLKMTFLEGDHVNVCDLLVSRRTVYLVVGSACDKIWARYSGYKWVPTSNRSKTLTF